jgi:hypothetical protein
MVDFLALFVSLRLRDGAVEIDLSRSVREGLWIRGAGDLEPVECDERRAFPSGERAVSCRRGENRNNDLRRAAEHFARMLTPGVGEKTIHKTGGRKWRDWMENWRW